MPELPEVETVRRQLFPQIVGKRIIKATVFHPKIVRFDTDFPRKIFRQRFTDIQRHGKYLFFHLEKGVLLNHLKMTGQWIYRDDSVAVGGGHLVEQLAKKLPTKHTHLHFVFEDSGELFFNDLRRFGWAYYGTLDDQQQIISKLGPEPLTADFSWEFFQQACQGKRGVKAWLLDQSQIAGVGNIYADEACFATRIHPNAPLNSLSLPQKKALWKNISCILEQAIASGGTTFSNFLHTDGQTGTYFDQVQVFGRQKKKCYHCETPIIKIRCAGRGTHLCPHCQKERQTKK